jgi:hypothetical protein
MSSAYRRPPRLNHCQSRPHALCQYDVRRSEGRGKCIFRYFPKEKPSLPQPTRAAPESRTSIEKYIAEKRAQAWTTIPMRRRRLARMLIEQHINRPRPLFIDLKKLNDLYDWEQKALEYAYGDDIMFNV